jgi:hypothetical protein
MGVIQIDKSKAKVYYNVQDGKVVQSYGKKKPEKEIPNLVSRINKNNETVYEVQHSAIEGYIESVSVETTELYGDKLVLVLSDGAESSTIQMNFSSNYAKSFLMRIRNISTTNNVILVPYSFEDKTTGKTRTGITVYQGSIANENKVASSFTKEEPNGLPPMKQIKVKGKDTWDDTDQLEFFKAELEVFKKKLSSFDSVPAITEEKKVAEPVADDLPF